MFRDFDQSTSHDTTSVLSTVRNKQYFKTQKLSGPFQQYDPITGEVVEEGQYLNGQEIGLWKIIDQDGHQQHFRFKQERIGAICRDGTYSTATGGGACSWHGGVAQWLHQNKRYQVGGTGKHQPIEVRLQKAKILLRDQLKMNINKSNNELMAEVMEKLIKNGNHQSKDEKIKDLHQQIEQMKHENELEIEKLLDNQDLIQAQNQSLKKQKKRLQQKLKLQNQKLKLQKDENQAEMKAQQQKFQERILEIRAQYQAKLKKREEQVSSSNQSTNNIPLSQSNQKKVQEQPKKQQNNQAQKQHQRKPTIPSEKTEKKKVKSKPKQSGNQQIKATLKHLQDQINRINRTIQLQDSRASQTSSRHQDSNSEQSSDQKTYQEKSSQKILKEISYADQDSSVVSHSRQNEVNSSISYEGILEAKTQCKKVEKPGNFAVQKQTLFKKGKINSQNNKKTELKSNFTQNPGQQSDDGVSLKTDSSDDWQDQQEINEQVFKSIPFKQSKVKSQNV